ncbi:MAG: TIGR04211 family SH3 domain-containing protein [Deltaproteobacteria bacterium]|nr:TIGR04211 family SH3 domain-containing protein [Deltaproteobacteria bacterium]MBW2218013.1 TIGR04211 family SH3 domain-containing protein [Deltaproteobacteria bacterium]
MKKTYCYALLFFFFLVSTANAETMYVSNIIKITLRTGPGTDHRVVKMLESGQKVEVLYQEEDWSQVRLLDGKDGWLLTRFISPEKPSGMLLKSLTGEHNVLLKETNSVREENSKLKKENNRLSVEFESTKKNLDKITDEYNALKKESADFLGLKSKYQKVKTNLTQQTEKAIDMEKQLIQNNIKFFLLGSGVLLIGFVIGFSTKRQRRRSSLL